MSSLPIKTIKKKIFILIIVAVLIVFVLGVLLLKNSLNSFSQSIFGFGINENNSATCEQITEISAKDTCFGVVAGNIKNPSLCEKISNKRQKDICLSGVANKLRDISLCEKIFDSWIKDLCYDNFK